MAAVTNVYISKATHSIIYCDNSRLSTNASHKNGELFSRFSDNEALCGKVIIEFMLNDKKNDSDSILKLTIMEHETSNVFTTFPLHFCYII